MWSSGFCSRLWPIISTRGETLPKNPRNFFFPDQSMSSTNEDQKPICTTSLHPHDHQIYSGTARVCFVWDITTLIQTAGKRGTKKEELNILFDINLYPKTLRKICDLSDFSAIFIQHHRAGHHFLCLQLLRLAYQSRHSHTHADGRAWPGHTAGPRGVPVHQITAAVWQPVAPRGGWWGRRGWNRGGGWTWAGCKVTAWRARGLYNLFTFLMKEFLVHARARVLARVDHLITDHTVIILNKEKMTDGECKRLLWNIIQSTANRRYVYQC